MITVQVSNFNGQINVPAHVTANITSDIAIKNVEWLCNKPVNYSVSQDQKTVNFTPSADGEYVFTCTVWNTNNEKAVAVGKVTVGTVQPTPVPPQPTPIPPSPTPTPTPAGLLWDSNINGKWNDGVKRTITTPQGTNKPDDKSIFVAASGSPKLVIDGDGTAHLVSGTGCDNLSIRLRSRHNEGGDPVNRFGGHGWSIDTKGAVSFKTEDYHNVHSNSHDFNSGINPGTTWHHVHQTLKGNNSTFSIDGKQVGSVTCSNHGDDSLLAKNSMIWLRLNNSDHGRIYICAINIDSALDFDFKFEANSIAFKNVKLNAL
jgi:hypothetical protein